MHIRRSAASEARATTRLVRSKGKGDEAWTVRNDLLEQEKREEVPEALWQPSGRCRRQAISHPPSASPPVPALVWSVQLRASCHISPLSVALLAQMQNSINTVDMQECGQLADDMIAVSCRWKGAHFVYVYNNRKG